MHPAGPWEGSYNQIGGCARFSTRRHRLGAPRVSPERIVLNRQKPEDYFRLDAPRLKWL